MVPSEVYLNKYVVSIAPFSTLACPDCSQNIQKTAVLHVFAFLIFHSFFQGGSSDRICLYVRTPMVAEYVHIISSYRSRHMNTKDVY